MPDPSSPLADRVRPPQVAWDVAPPPERLELPCPSCGAVERKTAVVAVDFITPDHPLRRSHVLRCPACTCCFFDDQTPPDYAEEAMLERGRVPFYIQQGAGLWQITRPLGQLRKPPGSRYLEVGCGFGFGLDFAIRAKGWQGSGLDPAGLSRLGREALGVPIEQRYLRDDDEAVGSVDVVMGSEVLEHVPSPRAFVRTLRRMLRPGGVLVLTTPNAEHIAPGTSAGALVPLLSPGLHLTLHTPHSIRRLLADAGFAQVQVETDSHALLAFASDAALQLETDPLAARRGYIDYLAGRARELPAESDAFLGFAGRAFVEQVNAGETTGAQATWARLVPACRARFGIELDSIDALPAGTDQAELDELARLMPLNLGIVLYGSAMLRLLSGTPRAALEQRFLLAAAASAALRRGLGRLAMEDAMTEDIAWTATAEALLCGAATGSAGIAARLHELPAAPVASVRRRGFIERALTTLVNAGHYGPARELALAEAMLDAAPAVGTPDDSGRDALFALGVLDVQPDGDASRAQRRFAQARDGLTMAHHLYWPALQGELQAISAQGDDAAAAALAQAAVQAGDAVGAEIPEPVRAHAAGGQA